MAKRGYDPDDPDREIRNSYNRDNDSKSASGIYVTLTDGTRRGMNESQNGDTFSFSYLKDLYGWRPSPDPNKTLEEFLEDRGLPWTEQVLKQYQDTYGGLPIRFNGNGTITLDANAKSNNYSYEKAEGGLSGFMEKAIPALAIGGMGAGLLGNLGIGPLAEGAAVGDTGASAGGALGEFGGAGGGLGEGISGAMNFGESFLPTLSTPGATTFSPLSGIETMAGGLGGGGSLISSGLGGLGNVLGSIAGGGVSGLGGLTDILQTIGGNTGGLEFGTGGEGSIWSSIGKLLGTAGQTLGGAQGAQSGLSPLLKLLGGGLEWYQSGQNADKLAEAIKAASEKADPFASQRPFYQDMLKQSYSDPNFFNNNPVFAGMRDIAVNDVGRKMSALGYNGSGNILHEIADRIQKQGMNYATQFQGQLAQNAGAGISPGVGASIAAQGANQVMQANQQQNGAMGNTLANIPGALSQVGSFLQGLI